MLVARVVFDRDLARSGWRRRSGCGNGSRRYRPRGLYVGELASIGQRRGSVEPGSRGGRCGSGRLLRGSIGLPAASRCWWRGRSTSSWGRGRRRSVSMASRGTSRRRQRRRRRSSPCALISTVRWGCRRWWWRCRRLVHLLLFVPQEVDNEFLVLLDKVVCQALVLEVLAEVLAPLGVKSIQHGEL